MKKEDRLRKAIKDAITTNISCDDGFYNWKDGGFHGLDDTLTAILKEFEGLEKENKELLRACELALKLINYVGCPECDGSGAKQISEDEAEQCQWCYELNKIKAIATAYKKGKI